MVQLQVGRRYKFVQRVRKGEECFAARVTSIDIRDGYKYVGFRPDDQRFGRWGFFKVRTDGASRPYGIVPIRECD